MSMNLCMGSYHCSSTTLDSRAQHRNTEPRCMLLATGDNTEYVLVGYLSEPINTVKLSNEQESDSFSVHNVN